jgi:HEAT repeat protein
MHLSRIMGATLLVLTLPGILAAQDQRKRQGAQRFRPGLDAPARPSDSPTNELNTIRTAPPSEVGGKSLSQWMNDLQSGDPSKRSLAIQMVIQFGEAASVAVPLLLNRTQDKDVSLRTKAIIALRSVKPEPKDVHRLVRTMAERMDYSTRATAPESQAIVRFEAARTLAEYADEAKDYLAILIRSTEDPGCCEVRQVALAILRRAGWDKKSGPAPQVTRAMIKALRDPSADVRLEAIIGLGTMGRPPQPSLLQEVLSALTAELRSPDKNLVIWANVSLMLLDEKVTDKSLDALARFLEKRDRRWGNNDLKVRMTAAQALGALGARSSPKIPNLMRLLDPSEEPPANVAACSALGMIGFDRKKGNEDITKALLQAAARTDDKQLSVVNAACGALLQIAPGDRGIAEDLVKLKDRPELQTKEKLPFRNVLSSWEQMIRNPPDKLRAER